VLKSNINMPFIIRMRSELQEGMYIDLSGHITAKFALLAARRLAPTMARHIYMTILDTATLGDHGEIWGELV
jgi:hypothetical protein